MHTSKALNLSRDSLSTSCQETHNETTCLLITTRLPRWSFINPTRVHLIMEFPWIPHSKRIAILKEVMETYINHSTYCISNVGLNSQGVAIYRRCILAILHPAVFSHLCPTASLPSSLTSSVPITKLCFHASDWYLAFIPIVTTRLHITIQLSKKVAHFPTQAPNFLEGNSLLPQANEKGKIGEVASCSLSYRSLERIMASHVDGDSWDRLMLGVCVAFHHSNGQNIM